MLSHHARPPPRLVLIAIMSPWQWPWTSHRRHHCHRVDTRQGGGGVAASSSRRACPPPPRVVVVPPHPRPCRLCVDAILLSSSCPSHRRRVDAGVVVVGSPLPHRACPPHCPHPPRPRPCHPHCRCVDARVVVVGSPSIICILTLHSTLRVLIVNANTILNRCLMD